MKDHTDEFRGFGRRRFIRIPFSIPVRFIFCGYDKDDLNDEGNYQYAFSKDVSVGGIQLKLKQKPKIAKYIKLKLTLPFETETRFLEVVGLISWTKYDDESGVHNTGVQFNDLYFQEKKILKDFIEMTFSQMHY